MAWQHCVNSQEKDVQRLEAIVRVCALATEMDPGHAHAWALMAIGQMILRFAHGRKDADGLMDTDLLSAAKPGTCYRATGNAQAALHLAEVTLARTEKRLAQDQDGVRALTYGAGRGHRGAARGGE